MSPLVRVNAVAPATVVKGSTMFPRDRVIASLESMDCLSATTIQTKTCATSLRLSTPNARSRKARSSPKTRLKQSFS